MASEKAPRTSAGSSQRVSLASRLDRSGRRHPISFETRILLLALGAGAPGSLVAILLIWWGSYSSKVQWTLSLFLVIAWLAFVVTLRERVVFPLQTIANLLAALREGDYSIRARVGRPDDALGAVLLEVNDLGRTLRQQRLGAVEATTLLNKVIEEIDVSIFTFDGDDRLRLVNKAGERLMAQPAERLLGREAEKLGLSECLKGESSATKSLVFPGGIGRWGIRRTSFREQGMPHTLLVLTDLSRALREEERQAWQRLVRVLGHELNNSLTPIKTMAGTLESLLKRPELPEDWQEDMGRGLSVIASRADALSRFMRAYSQLARLPQPQFAKVQVSELIQRVARLETRMDIRVQPGPELVIQADADQLEQLLINLIRNAVDASQETGGGVTVGWRSVLDRLEVMVDDEGPGLLNSANLFVPFFTTKPSGSGIGLVLSRQIAEAHGGTLMLENRSKGPGCRALLRLPVV